MAWCRPGRARSLCLSALGLAFGVAAVVIAAVLDARAGPSERVVVIGTAPVSSASFVAGGAVCALVNQGRARHGIRCLVESTSGSAENLDRLRLGDIDLALVQSDWQYLAVESGVGAEREPFQDLRAVFALHAQAVTVVANPLAGITRLDDLKGRRVSMGPADSGVRKTGEALIGALGWRSRDFEELADLDLAEQAEALCNGHIDAFILPVTHPNGAVAAAVGSCGAALVEVAGPAIERLVAEWPFYSPARIPGGLYAGNVLAVPSYGTRATLVTKEVLGDDIVYELAKAVFADVGALSAQNPSLMGLNDAEMVGPANSAPFHRGALRYYRERGWK